MNYPLKLNIKSLNKKNMKISLDNNVNKKINTKEDKYFSIINSELKYQINTDSITLMFYGARLLTVNQIFALLQSRKYEVFKYKKAWHRRVLLALYEIKNKHNLPFYDTAVELSLFRSDKRLVDEDSLTTMFKYLIDALKYNNENKIGIIKDDNKTVVKKIICHSNKGEPIVGINIKLSKESLRNINDIEFLKQQ